MEKEGFILSETTSNGSFTTTPTQDFDTVAFQGSMQQVLQENIGSYVLVEFLIGSNSLELRQGILYSVASQFLVLFDDLNLRYVVCDIFSVKFVTFLVVGTRPGQVPLPALVAGAANAGAGNAGAGNAGAGNAGAANADSANTGASPEAPAESQPAPQPESAPTFARSSVPTPAMTPAQAAYTYAVRKNLNTARRVT